jgi:PHD/YefM family antitoxin component YafN of YafNO toxin-antitoxin module
MTSSNVQIIKKNGKNEFAILPYKEYLKLQEELDDYENLRCLREAKQAEKSSPTIGIIELKKHLKTDSKK